VTLRRLVAKGRQQQQQQWQRSVTEFTLEQSKPDNRAAPQETHLSSLTES